MATSIPLRPMDTSPGWAASSARAASVGVPKALPLLNEGASIILAGSSSPSRGGPGSGVYSASGAAVRQFGRVWAAVELITGSELFADGGEVQVYP